MTLSNYARLLDPESQPIRALLIFIFQPCIQPPFIRAANTSLETRGHHCTKELHVGCEVIQMSWLLLNLEYVVV